MRDSDTARLPAAAPAYCSQWEYCAAINSFCRRLPRCSARTSHRGISPRRARCPNFVTCVIVKCLERHGCGLAAQHRKTAVSRDAQNQQRDHRASDQLSLIFLRRLHNRRAARTGRCRRCRRRCARTRLSLLRAGTLGAACVAALIVDGDRPPRIRVALQPLQIRAQIRSMLIPQLGIFLQSFGDDADRTPPANPDSLAKAAEAAAPVSPRKSRPKCFPQNACRPVAISYSTNPSENKSQRPSSIFCAHLLRRHVPHRAHRHSRTGEIRIAVHRRAADRHRLAHAARHHLLRQSEIQHLRLPAIASQKYLPA